MFTKIVATNTIIIYHIILFSETISAHTHVITVSKMRLLSID